MNFSILTFFIVLQLATLGKSHGARRGTPRSATGAGKAHRAAQTNEVLDAKEQKPCYEILKDCRQDKLCRISLNGLKTKCAVKSGRCNADMRNLHACAKIMDDVTKGIFKTDEKCFCEKNTARCAMIHEIIYDNPCFASVKILRGQNLIPKINETSKAAPATRDHDTITQSRDAVEELLAPFVESQDYVDESVMTSAILTRNPEVLKEVKEEESTSKDVQSKQLHDVTKDRDDQPSGQISSHSDVILLRVVAIATGVLLIVILSFGAALLVYFSMKRKSKTAETSKAVMT
ncbi:uncharacterized protein LOC143455874 isoform X2 [Clavelina lepadiformis]|uniref:uncharacterized protein LOC143455874 isoform X2 n=1 Tax=Clavelina lepadiformis TaxID=159417 RepID=UPI0040420B4E